MGLESLCAPERRALQVAEEQVRLALEHVKQGSLPLDRAILVDRLGHAAELLALVVYPRSNALVAVAEAPAP